MTGTVGSEGSGLLTTPILVLAAGVVARLEGPVALEVQMLTGALVTVCGQPGSARSALVTEAYELRQVDGMEAYLGTLETQADGLTLARGQGRLPLPLGRVPDVLARQTGERVWVAGVWEDGRFAVRSFGWIRQ